MLRVVADTNVVVSGTILSRGNPYEILEAWRRDELILVTSPEMISEIETVLRRPKLFKKYRLTEERLARLLTAFHEEAEVVTFGPTPLLPGIEPSDLKFLACAGAGAADYLITGDQTLLRLKRHKGTRIVDPRTFVAILHAAR